MKNFAVVALLLLALWGLSQAIGTTTEIKAALSITDQDITRLQWAVGQHQALKDGSGSRRDATLAEAIAELKSRINAFVLQEESRASRDTLGQWGGI